MYQQNYPNDDHETLKLIARESPYKLSWGDWEKLLTRDQFQVTRLKCNENPFSSSLNSISNYGIYECVSCGNKLFESKEKYKSGYGMTSICSNLHDILHFQHQFFEIFSKCFGIFKGKNTLFSKSAQKMV